MTLQVWFFTYALVLMAGLGVIAWGSKVGEVEDDEIGGLVLTCLFWPLAVTVMLLAWGLLVLADKVSPWEDDK